MKWKWTVPYLLTGVAVLTSLGMTTVRSGHGTSELSHDFPTNTHIYSASYRQVTEHKINEFRLDNKADCLRDKYVKNMLNAQEKLHPLLGKRNYYAAVRAELPGAPVGQHCVYGQYTHLNRALCEMGDTLTIIPRGGHASCTGFMYHMEKKYNKTEFPGCIHKGVMFETDSAYNVALEKYLKRSGVQANTPDSVRAQYMKKFAARNFSADGLNSGSIVIVPRYRGSQSKFHAILYLGRGRIEKGKFVADATGRHIYVGHNRENIGDLFKNYDMSKVFAADIREIARAEYGNELKRIESMSTEELIVFLSGADLSRKVLAAYPRDTLVRMARDLYFGTLNVASYEPIIKDAAKNYVDTTPWKFNQRMIQELKLNQKTL
ncbi:MAG: hypothetical protein E7007_01425 [Alphaproteobacteria bacterium]|nr:hypothetical protein [Alphaproteobacteria bacterium]